MTKTITKIPEKKNIYEAETELHDEIKAAIYKHAGVLTVASVLGVIRIVESEVLDEQD